MRARKNLTRTLAILSTFGGALACGAIVGVTDPVVVGGIDTVDSGPEEDVVVADVDLDALKLDYDTGAPTPPPIDAGCPVKSVGPVGPTFADRSETNVSVMQFNGLSGIKAADDSSEAALYALVSFPPHAAPSELLTLTQFHANVPATAKVITGLKLEVVGGANRADFFFDAEVLAVKGDPKQASRNRGIAAAWPQAGRGSFVTRTYGRDTDLWELPLTREYVNADDFGVALRFKKESGENEPTLQLDAVKLTVFYCE